MSESPVRIFVSYSHSDTEYLADGSLLGFLRGLERDGVEFWTDARIAAGDKWDDEIRSQISRSDIALVLVSQSFLDSEYCSSVEIAGFLHRSKQSGLVIVPVILSPCEWERHSWLQTTQYLPGNGHTIEENYVDPGARKRLFLTIRTNLREQVERRRQSRQAAPAPAAAPVRHSIAGERRQVTALQCELTALGGSSALDPEEIAQLLPEYRAGAAKILERLDGHSAERQGRRLLAYFGYPRAHEDDPLRAAIAAREIRQLAKTLGGGQSALAMKVAIHTGPMLIATAAGDAEPVLVGDVPDVVATVMSRTPPDAIHVTAPAHDLIGKEYTCSSAGSVELDDGGGSLGVYALGRDRKTITLSSSVTVPARTSFVAREHELQILRQRWELAGEGEGQVVYVSGQAGIGKSRLIKELLTEVGATASAVLKCRCSPHHQNTELYPLIDLFNRTLGFTRPEEQGAAIERLEALLRKSDMPLDTAMPLLCTLLSLPLPAGYEPVTLSPEGRKKNTLAVVLELILRLAAQQPLVMIVEDLHWIDVSTLGFLDMLVQTQASAAILTLLTFRPEFNPPWRQLSYLSEISLRRLGAKEAGALVARLTEGTELPPGVVEEIVAKADGIPLFAEELTKMVTESTTGGTTLAVPSTLEGSLIARLDRLDTAKEVAQVAAVIGREFFHDLLCHAVSADETELANDLDRLLKSEIILRRGLPAEASYVFKHALIQQAAYESVLNRDARQLHGRIAEALESKFPDLVERQPEVAALHFARAGMAQRAIDYLQLAAERSIRNSANSEAAAHLMKCLQLLAEQPAGRERDRLEMKLRTTLALPLIACRGYAAVEVDEELSRARQLCTEVGDDAELFRVLRLLWAFQTVRGNHHEAFEAAQQIEVLATSQDADHLRMEAARVLGSSFFYMGRLDEAHQHFESAIDFYDRNRDHGHVLVYGQDPGVSSLASQSLTLWFRGDPDQAEARASQAVALARELGHPYSLCYALFFCCWQYVFLRDPDQVEQCAEEMIRVSRHQSFPFWETMGMITKGWISAQRGEPAAGLAMMTEWLAKSRTLGSQLFFPTFYGMKAEGHAALGDVEGALAAVDEGLAIRDATGETFCEPELYRLKGELLAIQAPGSLVAEEWLVRAREVAAAAGSKSLELRAATSLARLRIRGVPRCV